MFLSYKDLAKLFPNTRGIKEETLVFHTVASKGTDPQAKGIFILLSNNPGELKSALENGAIAAIWPSGMEVPKITPNHFPMFFVHDLLDGLKKILFLYKQRLQEDDGINTERTDFLFLDERLLKEFYETYDIAVMEEKWSEVVKQLSFGGKE
jgi:hypothetical protein